MQRKLYCKMPAEQRHHLCAYGSASCAPSILASAANNWTQAISAPGRLLRPPRKPFCLLDESQVPDRRRWLSNGTSTRQIEKQQYLSDRLQAQKRQDPNGCLSRLSAGRGSIVQRRCCVRLRRQFPNAAGGAGCICWPCVLHQRACGCRRHCELCLRQPAAASRWNGTPLQNETLAPIQRKDGRHSMKQGIINLCSLSLCAKLSGVGAIKKDGSVEQDTEQSY